MTGLLMMLLFFTTRLDDTSLEFFYFLCVCVFRCLRGHVVSTPGMIDLSSDPTHSGHPCGSCEFCVREAAVLSAANAALDHHHVCVQDLENELTAAGLTTTATLGRHHHNTYSNTLPRQQQHHHHNQHQSNAVTFDPNMDSESNIMRSNSRLTSSSKKNILHSHSRSRVHVPVTVCLIIMSSYIILGGLMFSRWNARWTLLDGSFFSFISLTTVGLSASPSSGEALFSPHGSLFQGSLRRLYGCTLYLLVGFALLSMSIHLVYHDIVRRVRRFGRKLSSCFCSSNRTPDEDRKQLQGSQDPINDVAVLRGNGYEIDLEGS